MFNGIVGNIGELRTDIATGVIYRYNGSTWIVNKSGTPSSAAFPTSGNDVGDIREDILTGFTYRWSGSAWVLITKAGDTDEDGIPDTVEDGGITAAKIATGAVTTTKIVANAVTKAKTTITVYDVTVATGQTTGTVTVAAGSIVLGIVPVSNQDQLVDSVLVSDTTLTVTLAAAATADNVFTVSAIV